MELVVASPQAATAGGPWRDHLSRLWPRAVPVPSPTSPLGAAPSPLSDMNLGHPKPTQRTSVLVRWRRIIRAIRTVCGCCLPQTVGLLVTGEFRKLAKHRTALECREVCCGLCCVQGTQPVTRVHHRAPQSAPKFISCFNVLVLVVRIVEPELLENTAEGGTRVPPPRG